jgi:hypothetical protein
MELATAVARGFRGNSNEPNQEQSRRNPQVITQMVS